MKSETALLAQVVSEPPVASAHRLRREPYRLFFLLGLALSWAGVGHWFLHALGVLPDFKPVFHAMTQIQGFLISFALGFLFTMIPRRTETAPPSWLQIGIGVVCPIGTSVSAWFGAWAVAQAFWLVLGSMLIGFLLSRIRATRAKRRPPNSFVWLPVAFMLGMGGAVLAGVGAMSGRWWLHQLGQTFVLQGMFVSLVLGVGGLALPLMTRGEKPADGGDAARDVNARSAHVAAALLLIGSFVLEARVEPRIAYVLRGLLVLGVLLASSRIDRRPSRPGWNRWLIWSAAWAIPLGYFAAAAMELHPKAGLHLTFIGGLALLTLSVSTQVTLGHGGFDALLSGRPWASAAIGVLSFSAIVPRMLMDLDPDRYFLWLGIAAGLFLAATGSWLLFLGPKLLRMAPVPGS